MTENSYKNYCGEYGAADTPKGLPSNRHYGLNTESESFKLYDAEVILGSSSSEYPEEFQLARTVTIKNQGDTGGCLACTLATIAEYYYGKQMSEGWNYGEFRLPTQKNSGLYASTALDSFKNIGQVPLSEFGKMTEMQEIRALTQKLPELKELAAKYRITGYAKISRNKIKRDVAIKDFLSKYSYPLVGASRDYFSEAHAITIDGWNDTTDCYKFQNSWGTEWGDKGYGEIPKEELSEVYALFFEPLELPFKDVTEEHWAYKYIKGMYFNGLINGTSEDAFEPERAVTRAEVAAIIYRLCEKLDEREIRKDKIR